MKKDGIWLEWPFFKLTWQWSLECASWWIFFAAESSCKCTEKLNLICGCRTFGFHFSSATNFGWLSLDQFLMVSEYRQILHETANFPALHTDFSRVALNAFLRNYYFWILKTYQDVMHYDQWPLWCFFSEGFFWLLQNLDDSKTSKIVDETKSVPLDDYCQLRRLKQESERGCNVTL